jgi:hypothetical protein
MMQKTLQAIRLTVFLINLLIVGVVLWRVKIINDDKAILIYVVYYPILLLLNFLFWVILTLLKNEHSQTFGEVTLILLILLMPLFFIAARF